MWQWRQRKDRAEISRQRLEREAESERLRLRLTSIQEPEPVIDLTDAPSGGSAAAAPSSPSPALTETAAPVLSVVVDPAAVATPSGNGSSADRHDDLKRIKGIGPVMERSLNEQGIHSFEQLANLTKPEIDRLTAAIAAFPGRIEREDWVGSARRLLDAEQPASDSPLF